MCNEQVEEQSHRAEIEHSRIKMTKPRREFIIATLVLSTVATVFCIVSLVTENWIVASAILNEQLRSDVTYGLFTGTLLRRQLAATLQFQLTVVCDFGAGACVQSCQRSSEQRQDELNRILRGGSLKPCEQMRLGVGDMSQIYRLEGEEPSEEAVSEVSYMSAGLWLSSTLFACATPLLTLMATCFNLLNLYTNPVERIFNIFGLYIWNAGAIACSTMAMLLWGILYQINLRQNIAVTDTLRNELTFSSDGMAALGYSFYLLLFTALLSAINIIILYLRQHLTPRQKGVSRIFDSAPLQFY